MEKRYGYERKWVEAVLKLKRRVSVLQSDLEGSEEERSKELQALEAKYMKLLQFTEEENATLKKLLEGSENRYDTLN